jgi:hypothetical protein
LTVLFRSPGRFPGEKQLSNLGRSWETTKETWFRGEKQRKKNGSGATTETTENSFKPVAWAKQTGEKHNPGEKQRYNKTTKNKKPVKQTKLLSS